MECAVIPIISRQSTAEIYLWCRQCGLQFRTVIPVTMRAEQVECPGCELEGFCVGQSRK